MRAAQKQGRSAHAGLFGHEFGFAAENAFGRLAVDEDLHVLFCHLSVKFDLEVEAGTGQETGRIHRIDGRSRIDTAGVRERQPQSGSCRQNRTFAHETPSFCEKSAPFGNTFTRPEAGEISADAGRQTEGNNG